MQDKLNEDQERNGLPLQLLALVTGEFAPVVRSKDNQKYVIFLEPNIN